MGISSLTRHWMPDRHADIQGTLSHISPGQKVAGDTTAKSHAKTQFDVSGTNRMFLNALEINLKVL